MATINLDGFGHCEYEAVAANKTLDAGDSGVVQNVTATCTVTLPAVAAGTSGLTAIVRVGANGKTVTISPNSGDKIVGNGFTAADDKDMIFTNQPEGSYVVLMAVNEATTDSAWVVQRILGTATREA